MHEEDPRLDLEHLLKDEAEETLVRTNEDEAMEDAVVADGTAGVEEEPPLRIPDLVHSVLTVASMDTMLRSVQRLQVHPVVVGLRNL